MPVDFVRSLTPILVASRGHPAGGVESPPGVPLLPYTNLSRFPALIGSSWVWVLPSWADCISPLHRFPAAPQVVFREPLRSVQAEEGASATLRCELSQPNAAVVWSKGGLELQADGRWEPRQRGYTAELVLWDLRREDAGEYTCACGPQATSATLTVTGGPQGNTCPRGKSLVLWAGPLGAAPPWESLGG